MAPRRLVLASLLFASACGSAYADPSIAARPAPPPSQIALGIAPAKLRAPYDVQILRDDGEQMPTYGFRDRFYVQGNADERYVIRIANPTDHRIEAVVSVDGLDVIDGENGDLRKRGYVVPAYGETRIEGFRTSQADVATFRFSSVSGSYAGQKGKARNVGVIAVALFDEQAVPEQQIVAGSTPPPPPRPYPRQYFDEDSGAADAAKADRPTRAPAKKRGAAAESAPATRSAPAAAAPAGGAGSFRAPADDAGDAAEAAPARDRLGLGTEFGEQRTSSVSFTRFVRAPGKPAAIAELRYNDTAGLIALGIPVQPIPDDGELDTREAANPFPGDRFARPAR